MNIISKKRADNFNSYFWLSDPLLIDWIILHLLPYGNSICELGAGTGNMLDTYETNFDKIILVEPCSYMFNILKKKNISLKTQLLNTSAEKTGLDSKVVDIVISKSSLHHFANINLALNEMYRISKNIISIVEVIAPDLICIPFAKEVVLRKEKNRKETTIFSEDILIKYIRNYTPEYRSLHFDQYIDVGIWLKKSDLEESEQKYIYDYITSQPKLIRQKMQIHFRNNRLFMLRRMNLVIGVK